ncbi:hypothetical protein [Sphingomonas sp. LaA6.9]|uniref:hypothetical protein n=1 Tax=Sphingomonas sp. LaA6.9 TaxID=2919914 RepID=UPI001F4F7AC8|nr:hypothetical protein [Sphingomonas sp. LaA6.9]MCJ8159538.1 hypothetical protein [Sphingomonas sp. LaA6.9]
MSENTGYKAPIWFWVVAVLGLLWELMGVGSYLYHVTLSPEGLAALPQGQRDLMNATPVWVTAAFAIAVFSGLAGGLGLVLRRRWARPLLVLSVVAAILQFGWVFLVFRAHETLGPSSAAFPAFIIVMGVFLAWFAGHATKRGWLR